MTEFITRSCKTENRYEVIIKTDSEEHYKATENFARKLIGYAKPQTNEDVILAMSSEELMDFIARLVTAHGVDVAAAFGERLSAEDVKEIEEFNRNIWDVWAKQPAEEECNED